MLSLIKNLMQFMHLPSAHEQELGYLNAAISRADLERRERDIDAGKFRQGYAFY